jgi:hypothetical protein
VVASGAEEIINTKEEQMQVQTKRGCAADAKTVPGDRMWLDKDYFVADLRLRSELQNNVKLYVAAASFYIGITNLKLRSCSVLSLSTFAHFCVRGMSG